MRVLVTGLGGELGTRVAQLLEERPEVTEIAGVDFLPPRRRLRRTEFHRIDPRRRERLVEFVADFAPQGLAHFGVYEPASRMSPASAAERTELATIASLSAAARGGALEAVVVRSGLEVYGRRSPRASVPDEQVPPAPSTPYGMSLLGVEAMAAGLGRRHDLPVAALRYAPVVGSHVPSPLGRLLRLPAVPVPAFADPPFSLLHPDDAAAAMAEALIRRVDGPLNVVGPGAASPWQAARLGGRVPVPIVGPGWRWAGRIAELAGAAIAPHIVEVLRFGRTASGSRAVAELGLDDLKPTQQVLTELYEWAAIVPLAPVAEEVA
ncbi:MAG TPA: NAD-dependent epimerase/dehydratase family protein [Acidimicrobiia bacterium]|nr:NAD-dependent epimerase/dehydratase family protein [Acidimicrobiia bacterium]